MAIAPGGTQRTDPVATVPHGMRVAAAWSWRLLAISAAGFVLLVVASRLALVVGAFAAALLLAAALQPLAARLVERGVPRLASAWAVLVVLVVTLGAVAWFVGRAVVGELDDLRETVVQGIEDVREWMVDGPLGLHDSQIDAAITSAIDWLRDGDSTVVTEGLLTAAATAGQVVSGALLALFVLFFLLYDGRTIWSWLLHLLPRAVRDDVDDAGTHAWATLVAYVRSMLVVALVDATLIAVVLLVLDVPLVPALAVLTFLAAFVPVIGATLAGVVAVLVALVDEGPLVALVVAAAVLLIQWVDSDVLQPIVVGRATRLHPLAVGLAVTTGAILGGIGGAVIAVPIMAVVNTAAGRLARGGGTAQARSADAP